MTKFGLILEPTIKNLSIPNRTPLIPPSCQPLPNPGVAYQKKYPPFSAQNFFATNCLTKKFQFPFPAIPQIQKIQILNTKLF
jgi:hypothetical protein